MDGVRGKASEVPSEKKMIGNIRILRSFLNSALQTTLCCTRDKKNYFLSSSIADLLSARFVQSIMAISLWVQTPFPSQTDKNTCIQGHVDIICLSLSGQKSWSKITVIVSDISRVKPCVTRNWINCMVQVSGKTKPILWKRLLIIVVLIQNTQINLEEINSYYVAADRFTKSSV